MREVIEELTFFEFAEKFLGLNDMQTPVDLDISSLGIEIESTSLKQVTLDDVFLHLTGKGLRE